MVNNRLIATASDEPVDARGGGLGAFILGLAQNVVVAGNTAVGSSGLETGSAGGDALGGGVMVTSDNNNSSLDGITIGNNQAIAGQGGDGQPDGEARSGGIFTTAGHSVIAASSIFFGNIEVAADGTVTPNDCINGRADRFLSLGFNVVGAPADTCDFEASTDLVGVDPEFYALADYGCATPLPDGSCVPTLAIDQTSPAADAGRCLTADFIMEDSRNLPRPFDLPAVDNNAGDGCDSGAFEAIDVDGDGFTEAADCDPLNPDVNAADRCGVCGGDGTSCVLFEDGFESGDTTAWN
ncbi:MAG: choice-of-anchor Q domain-containing protein [Acidobacteriota bacterium]